MTINEIKFFIHFLWNEYGHTFMFYKVNKKVLIWVACAYMADKVGLTNPEKEIDANVIFDSEEDIIEI